MRFLGPVIVLFLAAACTGEIHLPDEPDDLIPRDSMVVVMRELVVLEAYFQTQYQQVGTYYRSMSRSGKHCLKKYNITPERFERSYNHYVSRQEELQSIYAAVIDSLNKEVNKMPDSLRRPVIDQPDNPALQLE